MTILLEIPDDLTAWPAWLERQLVAPSLGDLVEQLALVFEPSASRPDLQTACGDRLNFVRERGLSVLSPEQIRTVVRHPELLLELQEYILQQGGSYWTQLLQAAESPELIDQQWRQIESRLGSPPSLTMLQPPAVSRRRVVAWVAGGVAAAILMGIFFLGQPSARGNWGWDRPGALASKLPANEYLPYLGEVAGEWFDQPRETPEELKSRLKEFRRSCDTLIGAGHPQLASNDRRWLVEKCRAWSKKTEGYLKDLEQGKSFEEVRDMADATIRQLQKALNERQVEAAAAA